MNTVLGAWLYLLVGAVGGGLLFWAGARVMQMNPMRRGTIGVVGVLVCSFAVASRFGRMQDYTHRLWLNLGGEDFVATLTAQFLVGMAWGRLRRKIPRLTIAIAGVAVWCKLLVLSISPLFWRYGGESLFDAKPDEAGLLRQHSLFTCAPAAGSMLLYRHGLRVTEGQVAKAAHTFVLFGTNDYALAQGMERLIGGKGLAVKVLVGTAEEATRFPMPFVTRLKYPKWCYHTVMVQSFDRGRVHIVCPSRGKRKSLGLKQWRQMWQGRAIVLERHTGKPEVSPLARRKDSSCRETRDSEPIVLAARRVELDSLKTAKSQTRRTRLSLRPHGTVQGKSHVHSGSTTI